MVFFEIWRLTNRNFPLLISSDLQSALVLSCGTFKKNGALELYCGAARTRSVPIIDSQA